MHTITKDFTNFDIVGDIHGHSNDLKQLLSALGYTNTNGYFQHPERKVLFIGDYIDRGVNVIEVLDIVKKMVDNNQAIALMGNHEYNAICYNTKSSKGEYLREHNKKNFNQHAVTMAAFMQDAELYKMYIEWFKTLPLFYENDSFRAVHACWDHKSIEILKNRLVNNCLTDDLLEESSTIGTDLHMAVEISLKGKEATLPEGLSFIDNDRILRTEFRIKWWENPQEITYSNMSIHPIDNLPAIPFQYTDSDYYKPGEKPVFFGHYWMPYSENEKPTILKENVCCLDFSIAKDGKLICYRYSNESVLDSNKIAYIK